MPQTPSNVSTKQKCSKGEMIVTGVFFVLLISGGFLRFLGRAAGATDEERFNCFAAAFAISVVLDVMFGVCSYIASQVKQTAEQRRCCTSYFAYSMTAYWVLTVLCVVFDCLGASKKVPDGARFICGVLEIMCTVAWIMLFLSNIEGAYRPKEDVVVVDDAANAV